MFNARRRRLNVGRLVLMLEPPSARRRLEPRAHRALQRPQNQRRV